MLTIKLGGLCLMLGMTALSNATAAPADNFRRCINKHFARTAC